MISGGLPIARYLYPGQTYTPLQWWTPQTTFAASGARQQIAQFRTRPAVLSRLALLSVYTNIIDVNGNEILLEYQGGPSDPYHLAGQLFFQTVPVFAVLEPLTTVTVWASGVAGRNVQVAITGWDYAAP